MSAAIADSKFVGDCPFCPLKRMINDRTGKEFKTCFKCRFICPNGLVCKNYRGKSPTGFRYKTCASCKFGDKYSSDKLPRNAVDLSGVPADSSDNEDQPLERMPTLSRIPVSDLVTSE
jgi:hypothetical protein